MKNRNILIVIVVILAGIFTVLAANYYEDHGKPKSTIEKIGDDVSEAIEEVGDEVDDHTDAR